MEITNNFGLPEFVVEALTFSDYSRGDAQISVTQLIDSPRIVQLQKQFAGEQKKDAVDFVWSRFGTSVHNMFEESLKAAESDAITEERLFTEWRGWRLSGAIDVQEVHEDGVIISDFKVTSVWSVINDKPSWHQQLNVYAYLVRKAKGQAVKKLQIVTLLRDWSRRKAEQERNYPSAPIVIIDIPVWSDEQQDQYVDAQMQKHIDAEFDASTEQTLIACTYEEMWEKATVYAVMKKGRKSAVRLYKTEAEAEERAEKEGRHHPSRSINHYVEVRKGEKTRCAGDWCGVSLWCDQYQAEVWGAK
jgi:hypothetical protein